MLLFYLLMWTAEWIWGYFTRAPSEFYITVGAAVAALIIGVWSYKNEKIYTYLNEVSAELKKVTWPGPKEVKAASIVTIVMTIISASILGVFDFVWRMVTNLIYGGG
ncbi:MAG: preprotein translocase subunit SecE [Deltaproteobacteria bacterium]|nr:preprotein translocase subunit SecE [Deltaproteobacteria bacterium]